MKNHTHFIIGFLISIGLTLSATPAHAIFSPTLGNQIEIIKQHVNAAAQGNHSSTTGSIPQAAEKVFDDTVVESLKEHDKKSREAGQPTALPGQYTQFLEEATTNVITDALERFGESLSLLFNQLPTKDKTVTITSCLRDDIFELQDLRDAVLREALRSALLRNKEHASILWSDYKDLNALSTLLKERYEDTDLFFPENQNYYIDCPYGGFLGEFGAAFEEVSNAWDYFTTLATAQGLTGNIWEMAKANARKKATEWIAKNQITLSLGGKEGGNTQYIYKAGEGTGGIGAIFETQWGALKSILGPVTPLFDPALYTGEGADMSNLCAYYKGDVNRWEPCTNEQIQAFEKGDCERCRTRISERNPAEIAREVQYVTEEKQQELFEAQTALTYNLKFNSIAEQNTQAFEVRLLAINTQIKRGFEAFGKQGGPGISSLCEDLKTNILQKHCVNHGSAAIPVCK